MSMSCPFKTTGGACTVASCAESFSGDINVETFGETVATGVLVGALDEPGDAFGGVKSAGGVCVVSLEERVAPATVLGV